MPRTLTAQNIVNIGAINFVFDEAGELSELNVTVEVNYGTLGLTETVNILPLLPAPRETNRAKALYEAIKRELEEYYLA